MSSPSGPSTQTPGSRSMMSWLAKAAAKYSQVAREARFAAWPGSPLSNPRLSGLRLSPVVAGADIDGKRRVEVVRAAHLRPHEVTNLRDLRVRNLEEELVVH